MNKYNLNVRVLAGRKQLRQAMVATQGKVLSDKCRPLSNEGMAKAIISQHGSLNTYIFHVTAIVPDRIHTHIRTHHLVNEFYSCSTSRPDLTDNNGATRIINFYLPLKRAIEIAGLRLCERSWHESIDFYQELCNEMIKIEPYLELVLQPRCVNDGICREGLNCCKYTITKDYEEKRRRLCIASIDMINGRKLITKEK